jgi:hypothetical protein
MNKQLTTLVELGTNISHSDILHSMNNGLNSFKITIITN